MSIVLLYLKSVALLARGYITVNNLIKTVAAALLDTFTHKTVRTQPLDYVFT